MGGSGFSGKLKACLQITYLIQGRAWRMIRIIFTLIMLLCVPAQSRAWENYRPVSKTAYVQGLEEGNILIMNDRDRSDKDNFAIRLYGIGIPTLRQPFGREAKKEIEALLPKGSKVIISTVKTDEEGVTSALVQRNDHSINNRLIELGLAWVDRRTCKAFFCRRWHIQEHISLKDRRGIWALNIPTPPWQWGE